MSSKLDERFIMCRVCSPIALALLLGCSGPAGEVAELPEPFTDATAMRDCAPWDGAAVTVFLTSGPLDTLTTPTPPYLQLTVWRPLSDLGNSTFAWPSDEQIGTGFYCVADGECEPALTGTIRFRRAEADSTLSGDFELTFAGKDPFSGGFRAAWLPRMALCG